MRIFVNHKLITGMFAAAFAFVLGGFAWALAALGAWSNGGSGPRILHFNDIAGITQLGTAGDVMLAGIFAVIVVAVNFTIALELDARDRIMGKVTAVITLAASILLFIACTAILGVN
ncbi:MAG: hypothetical protein P4L67_00705 [Candidatus Pacebacteria bacterium]|nr:hypothetical protein [Candidatus Paceibacterota bacterium]